MVGERDNDTGCALGALFDIQKLNASSYGYRCWKVLWSAIDPENIAPRICLKAIRRVLPIRTVSPYRKDDNILARVKTALLRSDDFIKVAANTRF